MQGQEGVTKGEAVMATITRSEVASMLGVSVATVRRMEGKSLHPKMVDRTWAFDPDEVAKVQRSPSRTTKRPPSDGELAAEIFRRFDLRQSLGEIVREFRQSPKVVQALYREWSTPLGGTPDDQDDRALTTRDEQDLVRWEQDMRAMIATDEEHDLQERLAREARRERRTHRS